MSLLELLNELIVSIIRCLDDELDIYAVARANRQLFSLGIHYLYLFNYESSENDAVDWAVRNGQVNTIRRALDVGVCLDFALLIAAAEEGQTASLELLLGSRNDKSALVGDSGALLLRLAAEWGHEDTMQFLLDRGVDVGHAASAALYVASCDGHLGTVKLLLDRGADPNVPASYDTDQSSSLIIAAIYDHVDIVHLLLDKDAYVDTVCHNGRSSLHHAARYGHSLMIKVLIDHGANIYKEDNKGWRPLTLALSHQHTPAAKTLLESGADYTIEDDPTRVPLILASSAGMLDIVSILLERGADVRASDDSVQTALFNAVDNGHTETVSLLLAHGANTESKGNCGCTLLMHAARDECIEIVKVLLRAGANTFETNSTGWAAIHSAVHAGRVTSSTLLIEHNVEVAATRTILGATAAHLAAEKGNRQILQLLSSLPGNTVDTKDYIGRTPLFYAARTGKFDSMRSLLNQGADVAVKDHYGTSAIFLAVRNGHLAATECLLRADPTCIASSDIFNESLIWWAARGGNDYIIPLLSKYSRKMELDVKQSDLGADLDNEPFSPDRCWCDICTRSIDKHTVARECTICSGGSFTICGYCIGRATCLDETHQADGKWVMHDGCSNCR
ncbi:hypothetical protein ACLOAV_008336 [Pseudogymnoascus australis]